ncbi:g6168 [Coccomyxa elongata]
MEEPDVAAPLAASLGGTMVYGCWTAALVLAYYLWKILGKQPLRPGLKRYEELPGPRELPLLRSLLHVYMGPRPQINKLWTRLAIQHGPIYKFRIPGKNFVVVSDPKLIPAILGRPGLPKTSIYSLIRVLFSPYDHNNLFTVLDHSNDEEWKEVRKAFLKSMSSERIRHYFPIILTRTLELCKHLQRMGPGAIDAQDATQRVSLDIIMMAAFGLDHSCVDFTECEILDSLHYCFEEIFRRVTMPWRRVLFWAMPWLPSAKKNKGYHDRLYAAWDKICDSIRESGPYDDLDPSFLAIIGRQRESSTGKLWCREKLMTHAAGVVVAGMDTTAHAVSWAMFCIATYPGVQQRVAAELDEAGLLLTASRPMPRELKQDDLKDLVVLEAVIRESMRMFPVGGSGIGRYTDKAVNLGGYLIPAGTEVAVCLHTMHMVPWNFPEPERFNPDRWLATVEEGKSAPESPSDEAVGWEEQIDASSKGVSHAGACEKHDVERARSGIDAGTSGLAGVRECPGKKGGKLVLQDPHTGDPITNPYIPFSAGPRDCLGQRMGMTEVRVMLATICGRFRLELAPEMGGEAGVLEKQISSFTLAVDGGLHMYFHDRAKDVPVAIGAAPSVGFGAAADAGGKGKAAQQQGSSTRPVFNITATTRRPAQGPVQPFRG